MDSTDVSTTDAEGPDRPTAAHRPTASASPPLPGPQGDPDSPTSERLPCTVDAPMLREVYELLDVGVAILDPVGEGADFRISAMNPTALKVSHVQSAAVLGQPLSKVFPGTVAMGLLDAVRQTHRDGQHQALPPMRYRNGSRDGWYRASLHRLSSGQLMVIYVDVTADVIAEKALAESKTRYALLTQSMADGIYDWDIKNDELYLSPTWKAQLGYTDEELANTLETWQSVLHPDQREAVNRQLAHFIASQDQCWDLELQLRHRRGHYVWIQSRGTPIRDPDTGEVLRILGVHIDIDERKHEHLELERQRRTLDAVFEGSPDLYFLVDSHGLISDYQAGELSDIYTDPDATIGRHIADLLPEAVTVELTSAMQEARLTGELVTMVYSLPMPDGQSFFEARIRATSDGGYALIVRNVTRRQLAQQEMEKRVTELKGLNDVHRITQATGDLDELVRQLAPRIRRSLDPAESIQVTLEIDSLRTQYGDGNGHAKGLSVPIYDGSQVRGNLSIRHGDPSSAQATQSFLNATSLAIGLWLQRDNARRNLETYQKIVANTQDQLALVDTQLRFQIVNTAYAARIGKAPDELIGRTLEDMLAPTGFSNAVLENLKKALKGSVRQYREWRVTPAGDRFMNVLYSPYRQGDEVMGVIISVHDITDLHDAQAQLRRTARVFSDSGDAVMMTDLDGTISDVNPAFTEIFGYCADEAVGRSARLVATEDDPLSFFNDRPVPLGRSERWRGEVWGRRKNGERFPALVTVSAVEDDSGQGVSGYVAFFSDITHIKANEERLELLAHHDPLTGLANRAQLTRYLDSRIGRAPDRNDRFAVLFIDLDHFKAVNDTLGHSAGDRLLCEATQRLQSSVRASDFLARIGGDEFVAVLSDLRHSHNASSIAEKILSQLNEPFFIKEQRVQVSASIGVSSFPEDATTTELLLRNADTAMYESKAGGRSTWRCYTKQMTEEARRLMRLGTDLVDARGRGEQQLYFQPKFELASGRLCGLEALLRWTHPQLGSVSPREFIPIAQQGSLISDIDYWVLAESTRQIREWRDAGRAMPPVYVNISARTLADPEFVLRLTSLLSHQRLPADALGLDISESELRPDSHGAGDLLQAVSTLGVHLAIDDFGIGYSSLALLSRLPMSELKIDVSLIASLESNPKTEAIIAAVSAMCGRLDVKIVAEGVETQEQHNMLSEFAELQGQGYLYGRPCPAQDVPSLLTRAFCIEHAEGPAATRA